MASVPGATSSDHTSETVRKSPCERCEHEGLIAEATNFCAQCEEYMCTSCVTIHNGFKKLRDHNVAVSAVASKGQAGTGKISRLFCTDHTHEVVNLFCEKHDAMICESCKLLKHRKCKVVSAHDKATVTTYENELATVFESMAAMKCRIQSLKVDRESDVESLKQLEQSCIKDIKRFKTELIECLERLEKEMVDAVKNVVKNEMSLLQEHVSTCDVLLRKVTIDMHGGKEAKAVNDPLTSVLVTHKIRQSIRVIEPAITDIDAEVYRVGIEFVSSPTLDALFTGVARFGTLSITPRVAASLSVWPAYRAKIFTDMQAGSSTKIDIKSNCITGSAILADGQVMLVDYSNRQVILLDTMLTIKSTLQLPSAPWDVAADGANGAIVSLPESNLLQIINTNTPLQAGSNITTSGECWGVAVYGGEIYITVCSASNRGHIQVLDRSGKVLRRIGVDASHNGIFIRPCYMTVGTGGLVYVSDFESELIVCFTNSGDVVYNVKHVSRCDPYGITVDRAGSLLICYGKTNDIHVLKRDGSDYKVLLSMCDGVLHPHSIAYRQWDNKLIVTMKNTPSCVAYTLITTSNDVHESEQFHCSRVTTSGHTQRARPKHSVRYSDTKWPKRDT